MPAERSGAAARAWVRLALAVLLAAPKPVAPATITVDGGGGDVASDGLCTLVEAIENANDDAATHADCAAGSGADDIVLTVDVTLTSPIAGDSDDGTPRIVDGSAVTVLGNGHTVARDSGAADAFRIFSVAELGELTLDTVTVSGGLVSSAYRPSAGGGIFNRGTLALRNSTLSGNTVAPLEPYLSGYGGGLYNLGYAAIVDSTVSGNRVEALAAGSPYASFVSGGGIASGNFFAGPSPTLMVTGSTISSNSLDAATGGVVTAYGAGLYAATGTLQMVNSTLSGNSASIDALDVEVFGGGLASVDADSALTSSTLSGNSVQALGGMYALAAGAALAYVPVTPQFASFTLDGSAIGNHGGDSCFLSVGAAGIGGSGSIADDATCDTIPDTLTGLDPTLADNGGPTPTHALMAASTAIDHAGDCSPVTTDQRGVARPFGACDSGSFELVDCTAPDGSDLLVPDQIVDMELTFTTCDSITVADTDVMGPDGHLILRTAGVVIFQEGFSVDATGRLTVENDGSITVPETD